MSATSGTGWWLRSGCTRGLRLPVAAAAAADLYGVAFAAGMATAKAQADEDALRAGTWFRLGLRVGRGDDGAAEELRRLADGGEAV